MLNIRPALKHLAYYSGAFTALHRLRNRHRLTVAMLHRVLPEASAEWPGADPTYTLSDRLFAECLDFFKRHYNVISPGQLLLACEGLGRLPRRPLLITFDDGWADNAEVALPILRRAGLSAAIFIVSDAVDDVPEAWWEETLFAAWRRGDLDQAAGRALWQGATGNSAAPPDLRTAEGMLALAARISRIDAGWRRSLVAPFEDIRRRQMVTPAQLRSLADAGLVIGSHGATHAALTLADDAESELRRSRAALARLLGDRRVPTMLSYPHGRHSPEIVRMARKAGYRVQFTSGPWLNRLSRRRPVSDCLGRISIEGSLIADARGRLQPERLAGWLFLRRAGPA